ncbi:unnamed protein product [Rotaria sp. Silwood2]|nr:unnamed protein product [Rotaria sp. Silwood2]CAF4081949.1 unnamed protein product [Rotaria sp. Silwood2]
MINPLFIIIIFSFHLFLQIKCRIAETYKIKNSQEISINDHSRISSNDQLHICYLNDIQNQSILVWFTIEKSLYYMFDSYRFILRLIDDFSLSNVIIGILTNFTELTDFNNSLRIFNLDSGLYEVCIEFQMNFTSLIYQPRDGCVSMRIGKSPFDSLNPKPAPLLVALACGIVVFFILGLVVQWAKENRRRNLQNNHKSRSRSSSFLSTSSVKQQRDHLIRNLFRRHIDKPEASYMRQWARDLTSRHRIPTEKQHVKRKKTFRPWNKHLFSTTDHVLQEQLETKTISHDRILSSEPIISRNNIYTISEKVHHQTLPRKVSFELSISEKHEIV